MKSLMQLWKTLAIELASGCCTSTTMDIKTVHGRVEHEGLSFLTITLPSFGKDFERSLDQGYVDRSLFQGFSWKGGLPRFLGGFLDRVFDRGSGVLLEDPDIGAILAVRQLTLMFGKILLPCSNTRIRDAYEGFLQSEQEVQETNMRLTGSDLSDFHRISSLLFGTFFHRLNLRVENGEVVPKHGPGATADRLRANEKFGLDTWTSRLEEVFPYGDFLVPNCSFWDKLVDVTLLEPGQELPMKVITVPKTLKTPRLIGMEPTVTQYVQQGLLELIIHELRRSNRLHAMIGSEDQTINQRLAQEGSREGNLATLDLSEASDRVSGQLVWTMLKDHPTLRKAVFACRSLRADVDGRVIPLAKFAPMGSALCFPFESMVFLTCIFLGIEKELNTPLDWKAVNRLSSQVRIYGDDIIIPVDYVRSVTESLEHFGAKVNSHKSFWTGKFRESCGKEYYDGHDVSIVRVRREFPESRKDVPEVISLVSLRNQLYYAGCWSTVKWLDERIRKVIYHFPTVLPTSPVLGRHSFLGYYPEREHPTLHKPLVRGWVEDPKIPSNPLDGEGALLKFFLKRSSLPAADEKHLERSGRPHAVNIKLRWATPY